MIGRLEISLDLLLQILTGLQAGEQPRMFRVVKHGLPADIALKAAVIDMNGPSVQLHVEAESLEVSDGVVAAPWLETVFVEKEEQQ